ncbi:hypothetical protein LQZ21_12010 [Treponema sp. TIM-1]|uniref:hypothetical protein n=1 Tax=Treponema sp. TIM-1 TaxID=2898417 RepID=UPI003980826C
MKDPVTLAYINLYGILGGMEDLCALSPEAKELISVLPGGKPLTVGFTVKNGPAMTLSFTEQGCAARIGKGPCDIRLPFSGCEKFNGLIDGTVTPIPSKGFTKLRFLTQTFTKLTKILEQYLRPPADISDPGFFNASTVIMFFVIARTLSQIGNHDSIGRFTASNIADGTIVLSIAGGPKAAIQVKDHGLTASRTIPENYHALMEFESLSLARQLFDGKVNALACVGQGLISMQGNLGMLDNVNRLLDRAAFYLT